MVTYTCESCKKKFNEDKKYIYCKKCWDEMGAFGSIAKFLNRSGKKKKSRRGKKMKLKDEIELPEIEMSSIVKPLKYAFAVIFVLILALNTIAIVPAGHTGVVFNWMAGVKDVPLYSGFHFVIPFVETVTMMETRTQLVEQEASAVSKDLQLVTTSIAVNYRPVSETTPFLYKEIGTTYSTRLILPAIQESVKAITANYTAEQLIVRRSEVKSNIKDALIARLGMRGITVDDISITNFKFSDQFDAAIEAKVTAEQKALEAQRDLERIIIEKEQTITRAEAEAESTKRNADAFAYKRTVEADAEAYALEVLRAQLEKSDQLIEYKAIERWDGILPKFASGAVPFVDLQNYEGN